MSPSNGVAIAPRAQERLLHRVLRLVERRQHAVAVHVQLAPVPLRACGERGLLARDHYDSALTSWTSHTLPSGSLNVAKVP